MKASSKVADIPIWQNTSLHNLKNEFWKTIQDYPDYMCSNMGRVKSKTRTVKRNSGSIVRRKSQIIKQHFNSRGYLTVAVRKDKIRITKTAHCLISKTFLGSRPNKFVVDHINNIQGDNRICNLQYISPRENCNKEIKNKTSKYKGVYYDKQHKKWRSAIIINGKRKNLGRFNKETDAAKAYLDAIPKSEIK